MLLITKLAEEDEKIFQKKMPLFQILILCYKKYSNNVNFSI